ncbi:MAG: hypothetical protein NC341_08895 [Blautia sp.]|nr:hypothetical protein [Blautia sp.]MCM1201783.1 hypothetical protein [Bacteroides fragilis]
MKQNENEKLSGNPDLNDGLNGKDDPDSREDAELEKLVAMLDSFAASDGSRLKIDMSDELEAGESRRQYHHGRCDIGSPWARGCAFDVLEDEP